MNAVDWVAISWVIKPGYAYACGFILMLQLHPMHRVNSNDIFHFKNGYINLQLCIYTSTMNDDVADDYDAQMNISHVYTYSEERYT